MNARVPLPAGVTVGKSYEYGADINIGTPGDPTWQPVRRMSGLNPQWTPATQEAQTYDDLGSENSEVTGWSWVLAFIAQVNRSVTTGLYLEEIEALLARVGRASAKGEGAVIEVRWYHKPESGAANPTDAFQGAATVGISRQQTGAEGAIEQIAFTLTGKGPAEQIANPFTGWAASTPVVTSVLPGGEGTGEQVTITGSNLLGATSVKFGAVEATDFTIVSATTIVATLPAGSAGSAPVTVVTPGGTSAARAYSRAA